MELPVVTDLEYWQSAIDEIQRMVEKALSYIANRELDGDTANGITEQCFKMTILGVLVVSPTFANVEIESERDVEGGRIDLFLYSKERECALVIELKYVRIGFLSSTKDVFFLPRLEKYKAWRDADDSFRMLTRKERLLVTMRRQKEGTSTQQGKKITEVKQIAEIEEEGNSQALRYCRELRGGGIRRVDKKTRLFKVVITGVGKNVVISPLEEYK